MKLPHSKHKYIYNEMSWKISGEAEAGVTVLGMLFSKLCTRGGLHLHTYKESTFTIQRGQNSFQASINQKDVKAPYSNIHFLIALNLDAVRKHITEMAQHGLILYDPDEIQLPKEIESKKSILLYPVPLAKLASDAGADRLVQNTVALGAATAILDYDMVILEKLCSDTFTEKGQNIVQLHIQAARKGYMYIKEQSTKNNELETYPYRLAPVEIKGKERIVITGNEALSIGAVKAGVKFYAGSTLTASATFLQFLTKHQLDQNIIVIETDDTVSAGHIAIGAAFAGVRAIAVTTDSGFAPMIESLEVASITETPMVYIVQQQSGSASDLRFVLHAGQGEFPRIVAAPGDVDECFYIALQSCNLAERYQLPVIILTDTYLTQNAKSTNRFNETGYILERGKLIREEIKGEYKRYSFVESDGVSDRSIPGIRGGIFLANSNQHDEHGFTNEATDIRVAMQKKLFAKFMEACKELPEPVLYGSEKADVTIIGWGSTKGVILETLELLEQEHIKANFLQILYLSPFPSKAVSDVLENCHLPILVENNMTSQLGSLICEYTGYEIAAKVLKYDGRPFFPEELLLRIKALKSQKGLKKWLN